MKLIQFILVTSLILVSLFFSCSAYSSTCPPEPLKPCIPDFCIYNPETHWTNCPGTDFSAHPMCAAENQRYNSELEKCNNPPPPPPVLCNDGTPAPNNDASQCPKPPANSNCPDGTPAPNGDASKCPDFTLPPCPITASNTSFGWVGTYNPLLPPMPCDPNQAPEPSSKTHKCPDGTVKPLGEPCTLPIDKPVPMSKGDICKNFGICPKTLDPLDSAPVTKPPVVPPVLPTPVNPPNLQDIQQQIQNNPTAAPTSSGSGGSSQITKTITNPDGTKTTIIIPPSTTYSGGLSTGNNTTTSIIKGSTSTGSTSTGSTGDSASGDDKEIKIDWGTATAPELPDPPDYNQFDSAIKLANPFKDMHTDLPWWFPRLPENVSCSYEIHTTIFGRPFDMSPCARLQPLRSILAWVFGFMTLYACFRIVFKTSF